MFLLPTSLYQEIAYQDPLIIFQAFHDEMWSIFLDSANHQQPFETTNRYSYIAIDPYKTFWLKNGVNITGKQARDPFKCLNEVAHFQIAKIIGLPPFQGGIAGYFAYDLCHFLENIPLPAIDDMNFPDLAVGIYDVIISFDHHLRKAWIVSTGLPEMEPAPRNLKARQRLNVMLQKINNISKSVFLQQKIVLKSPIQANFNQDTYQQIVNSAIEYIREGDIFEVNLCQRFKAQLPLEMTAFKLYLRLRKLNPAPFSAFINLGDIAIVSASPERFLLLENGIIETRPIKGTTTRGRNAEEDEQLAAKLLKSRKDRSENIMIVDLMRNDLSKVCEDDSVEVTTLCGLETYANVHHLVSVIKGKLRKDLHALDLLAAAFPGGSVTGAPKVRAMQIISELEPNRRGFYCGSLGFISFTGDMDTSITIRTFGLNKNEVVYQAGGAVVLDSNPLQEYQETLDKVDLLTKALTG